MIQSFKSEHILFLQAHYPTYLVDLLSSLQIMKMNRKKVSFIVAVLWMSIAASAQTTYQKEIENWRQKRVESLKSENGWLNLVGLYWLQEGKSSFGSGDDVQIQFPKGSIKQHAGYFELKGTTVTIYVNDSTDIKINGKSLKKAIVFSVDSARAPIASSGSLKWTIIKRDDKIGIRLRDLNSPLAKEFEGTARFVTDSSWKIKAYLKKAEKPSNVFITNILGQTNAQSSPGKLFFIYAGKEYSLDALEEGKELFIVFGDNTSGKETYGAGRFLYADQPGADGFTFLDFNKAFNPPCAFTNYATCPLPPKQNILPFAITAGEKNYGHH